MQQLTIMYFDSSPRILVGQFHEKVQHDMESVAYIAETVMGRCSPIRLGLVQHVTHSYELGIHRRKVSKGVLQGVNDGYHPLLLRFLVSDVQIKKYAALVSFSKFNVAKKIQY
jgi:hypothetical protein